MGTNEEERFREFIASLLRRFRGLRMLRKMYLSRSIRRARRKRINEGKKFSELSASMLSMLWNAGFSRLERRIYPVINQ